mgnify:CR=1 FL=1
MAYKPTDGSGDDYRVKHVAGITVSPHDDIIIADNHILAFDSTGQFKVGAAIMCITTHELSILCRANSVTVFRC